MKKEDDRPDKRVKRLIELYADTISQSLDESLREFNAARLGPTPSEPIKETPMIHVDISSIPAEAYILQVTMTDHAQWDIPEAKQSVHVDIEMPRGDTGTIRIGWTESLLDEDGAKLLARCFEALIERLTVKTDPPSGPAPLPDTITAILESVERITGCNRPEEMLNWLDARETTRREATGKGPPTLREDIAAAINKHSAENGSNTPDFILANYLVGCLEQFDVAVQAREQWYNRKAKE